VRKIMKTLKKFSLALMTLVSFSGVVLAAPSTAPSNAPGRGQTGSSNVPNTGPSGNAWGYSNTQAGGGSSNGTGWTNPGTGGGSMGPGDGQDNRPGLGANQGCPAWMTGCQGSSNVPPPPEPPVPNVLRDPVPQNLEIMITRDGNLGGSATECGGNPEDCHDQANSPNATGLQFVDVTGAPAGGNGLLGLPTGMGSMLRTTVFTERGGLNVGQ
jgi:hypothetical protein